MSLEEKYTPNIIFILSDDQGEWAMGCSGNSEIITPNLDKLADEGIRFTNFFCVSPVCSPARASILTGMIPSQHGVHDWIKGGNTATDSYGDIPVCYLDGYETYSQKLADLGYQCGMTGKWHLGDSMTPQCGFAHWHVIERGGSNYYGSTFIDNGELKQSQEYITDRITNDALQFIEKRYQDENPFYLSVHYTAPHDPWWEKQHPKEVWERYEDCAFTATPNEPIHKWQINTCDAGYNQKSRRQLLKGYYTAVTAMDRGIGQILDKLEMLGIRENTLIIFTSDNGMNMGHHGIWGKGNGTYPQNMFDTAVKVPMIVSKPGEIPTSEVNDDLLSHYDIFPTLLDYLGIEMQTEHLPGQSFLSLLQGKPFDKNERIYIYDEYGATRMVRSKEWKYISRHPNGPNELYDLTHDPNETTNLFENACNPDIGQVLAHELDLWFEKYVESQKDGTKQKVFGRGQLRAVVGSDVQKLAFAKDYFYTAKLYRIGAFILRLFGQQKLL